MDWDNLNVLLNSNSDAEHVKSKGIDDLTNYVLITRHNVNDLKLGMHIKYVKNVFDINTNETKEKIYNGGFLVQILNGLKIFDLTLVLKSNITWKMKFIKYKIYGRSCDNFAPQLSKNMFIDEFQEEIDLKRQAIEQRFRPDLEKISRNKKKYKINFVENK